MDSPVLPILPGRVLLSAYLCPTRCVLPGFAPGRSGLGLRRVSASQFLTSPVVNLAAGDPIVPFSREDRVVAHAARNPVAARALAVRGVHYDRRERSPGEHQPSARERARTGERSFSRLFFRTSSFVYYQLPLEATAVSATPKSKGQRSSGRRVRPRSGLAWSSFSP